MRFTRLTFVEPGEIGVKSLKGMVLPEPAWLSILLAIVLLRIGASLLFAKGVWIEGDDIDYISEVENFRTQGVLNTTSFVADWSSERVHLEEVLEKLRASTSKRYEFLDFQWLFPLFYAPLFYLPSTFELILVLNNILWAGTVILLLLGTKAIRVGSRAWLLAFGLILFFPPSFQFVTQAFYSEPPFIFLLTLLVYNSFWRERTSELLSLLLLVLLCLVRPFGLVVGLVFACCGLSTRRMKMLLTGALALVVALAMNFQAKRLSHPAWEDGSREKTLAVTIYYACTPYGIGNTDSYRHSGYPGLNRNTDPVIQQYLRGTLTDADLLSVLLHQTYQQPTKSFEIIVAKTANYLFNYWPSVWQIGAKQSGLNKWGQVLFNGTVILLSLGGLRIGGQRHGFRRFYGLLWSSCYVFHMLLVSRYRYFLPVLVIGLPVAVDVLVAKASGILNHRNSGIRLAPKE